MGQRAEWAKALTSSDLISIFATAFSRRLANVAPPVRSVSSTKKFSVRSYEASSTISILIVFAVTPYEAGGGRELEREKRRGRR